MKERLRSPARRRFVGWALAGVVAGGAGLAAIRTTGYEVPPGVAGKLVSLAPWQWLVINAFAARVLAPERLDVATFADAYIIDLAESDARDVRAFCAYLEHLAPLGRGHFRRFTLLDAEAQDRVLERLENSSIGLLRAGFQALKALTMMAYYRRPESWQALGYEGPVVRWQG